MVNLLTQSIKLETIVIEHVIIEERHIQYVILIIIITDMYHYFCHTLRGYDAHISLNEAFEMCGTDQNVTAIPPSMEKLMAFVIGDNKFIDAFQFMASSLETLAEH